MALSLNLLPPILSMILGLDAIQWFFHGCNNPLLNPDPNSFSRLILLQNKPKWKWPGPTKGISSAKSSGFTQEQYHSLIGLLQQSQTTHHPTTNAISSTPMALTSKSSSSDGKRLTIWILNTSATDHITITLTYFLSYHTISPIFECHFYKTDFPFKTTTPTTSTSIPPQNPSQLPPSLDFNYAPAPTSTPTIPVEIIHTTSPHTPPAIDLQPTSPTSSPDHTTDILDVQPTSPNNYPPTHMP
ncbi:hypothetical protein KIW84_032487 [Lathyrus oleraceus]|uniref:Uncharacterized protein n=1 Tax=Pisum sativum TaxID=3888 RepID=A0A9D5AYR5_PEA|nr:hypothetical protein KIW84_032487 [Pisum sativum]